MDLLETAIRDLLTEATEEFIIDLKARVERVVAQATISDLERVEEMFRRTGIPFTRRLVAPADGPGEYVLLLFLDPGGPPTIRFGFTLSGALRQVGKEPPNG